MFVASCCSLISIHICYVVFFHLSIGVVVFYPPVSAPKSSRIDLGFGAASRPMVVFSLVGEGIRSPCHRLGDGVICEAKMTAAEMKYGRSEILLLISRGGLRT